MLVLVSPTKTQKTYPGESLNDSPFKHIQSEILDVLQSYSYDQLKSNMKISDKLTEALHNNLQNFKEENIAVHTYQGASFRPLQLDLWDRSYAQDHFAILSALYGLVKPYQAIGLYRLDFLVKFDLKLYDVWKDHITQYLNACNKTIISLASQEYEGMIHINQLTVPFIRLDFKEAVGDQFIAKSTYAKTARGNAANTIIINKIQTTNELKEMSFDGYTFNPDLSSESEFIYTR
ncbi:MAG TPA: peroxide stress protein YaaA [Erysipelothrix sp.]|nr:peroxide stress protein YaaA [Erysipelothrix sp.]